MVFNQLVVTFCREYNKFTFLRSKSDVKLGAVVEDKVEDVVKKVDIRRKDHSVICLAKSSNMFTMNVNTKTRVLNNVKLFFVIHFIKLF